MAFRYAGQFNGYVAKATGQIISFGRNIKRYKLNKYTQLVKTNDPLFIYYKIQPDDQVRLVTNKDAVWMDGAKRPEVTGNRIRHDVVEGQCIRYDYDFQIGWLTLQSADYNVLLANTNSAQNQCMIDWTKECIDLAQTVANWGANTALASDLAGGAQWDAGTPENPVIKKTLGQIAERITLATNGMAADYENVDDVGLIVVLSPRAARRMASTPEIHAIYKESMYADALVSKMAPNPNAVWQLPPMLYGFRIVVENAVQVNKRPAPDNAGTNQPTDDLAPLGEPSTDTGVRGFIKDSRSAIICSRPGGLDGELGAQNFSTLQRYWTGKGEMAVQVFDEAKHEYTDGHVVRHGTTKLAAPASGFLVQNILTPSLSA